MARLRIGRARRRLASVAPAPYKPGMIRSLLLAPLLFLAACAAAPSPPVDATTQPVAAEDRTGRDDIVILVGIDGLRDDAIDRFADAAPNLRALAEAGLRAAMIPAMPSVTFVNFYSIATGLHPDRHGVVSNAAHSRALARTMRRADHPQAEWWGGEPIWSTAEKQGVRAAAMFWLGSEAEIAGARPSFWSAYDHQKPFPERTAQVLAWLALPESERPRFITLYFHAVDSAAHAFGVGSPEEKAAIAAVDAEIGALLAGIAAAGLEDRAHVVVVSDHGMTNVPAGNIVHVDDFLSLDGVYIPEFEGPDGAGVAPLAHVFAETTDTDEIHAALAGRHPAMTAYRREDLPARWRMNHPDRTGDVVLVAEPGWLLWGRTLVSRYAGGPPKGMHGYDRHHPEMRAAFIARGPRLCGGCRAEPFDNVAVYGLVAEILGLEPAPNDGDPAAIRALLRD